MAEHSKCVQLHVSDVCRDAISLFSAQKDGRLPLVLIPTPRKSYSVMLTVPTGCYCLAQRFGKDVGEITPGLHILLPFWRIAYIVTKQICTYDAPVAICPTSDDVRVSVDVTLLFQINDPSKFIYKLGAKNFDNFLTGAVDEGIRMLVRRETHESVYALRGERADIILKILNDKFDNTGVRFLDCKVTSVWLPDTLAEYLETTTKLDKAMTKETRATEFEVLKIKQDAEMQIEEIKRKTEQLLVAENGRKRRAELEFEQQSVKAEETGRINMIKAEMGVEVKKKELLAKLGRTQISLEKFRLDEISLAEAESAAAMIQADTMEEHMYISAKLQEQEMVCDAMATKHEASAEKEASRSLQAKRKHELELKEKAILEQLGKQGNFNLVGTTGDTLVSSMMSGSLVK